MKMSKKFLIILCVLVLIISVVVAISLTNNKEQMIICEEKLTNTRHVKWQIYYKDDKITRREFYETEIMENLTRAYELEDYYKNTCERDKEEEDECIVKRTDKTIEFKVKYDCLGKGKNTNTCKELNLKEEIKLLEKYNFTCYEQE